MLLSHVQVNDPPCQIGYALWEPQGPERGTVVCVHGLSHQKRIFDFIADFLAAKGYRVFSFDAPGRGSSSWFENAEDYHFDVYVKVLSAALQSLGMTEPKSVHWIGSSMGGLIAMEMARAGFGDVFKTVTLVDVTHEPNRDACKRIADYLSDTTGYWDSMETYLAFAKKNFPFGLLTDEQWARFASHQLVKKDGRLAYHFDPKIMMLARQELLTGVNKAESLRAIKCPIALVAGEISDLCTDKEIKDIQAIIPNISVHIVKGTGHVPMLEDPPTQQFIASFIERGPV